jgi:hypothetical protein
LEAIIKYQIRGASKWRRIMISKNKRAIKLVGGASITI